MTIPRPLLDASRPKGATHVAGVDGGATKTVAAVLELETFHVSLGRGGPANVDAVGVDRAVDALQAATSAALEAAGVAGDSLGPTVFGIAGTIPTVVEGRIRQAFSLRDAYFVNDVVAAWASGTWLEPGVAVISGTGSHVFGVNAAGESWRTGGWGHILGDEGSGYWLGLEGIKAAIKYRDASGPQTSLLDACVRFYALRAIEEMQGVFYGKPLTKDEVAAFAREVAVAADAGDVVARSLFERGAADLAAQAQAPVRILGLAADGEEFVIALIGSVFAGAPLFRECFERAVRDYAPNARFVLPELAPVGGSLLLAVRAEGAWDRLDRASVRAMLAAEAPSVGA
jgi:N-acetylglucosamine kinase-like BadF-type ATPase